MKRKISKFQAVPQIIVLRRRSYLNEFALIFLLYVLCHNDGGALKERRRRRAERERERVFRNAKMDGNSFPNLILTRSRPGKPNQRKGQNEKFMNFAHFCEFWCFSLGKQARFTLNFCSRMPLRKVHGLTFLWFGLPGPLLI